jgi:hypothetical protein
MRETWESLIRDFVRHLKGTNRAVNTEAIYRRAALCLNPQDASQAERQRSSEGPLRATAGQSS